MGSTDTEPQAPEPKPNWFMRIISKPWLVLLIGFFGGIASIIALPAALFPGLVAPARKLTCCVYPIRTPIVQSARTSDVSVSYKGTPVEGNVTVAQVAIWNAGREAIKPEDVLSPIVLSTPADAPILELSIRKVSRDIIQPSLVLTNKPDIFDLIALKQTPHAPRGVTNSPTCWAKLDWKILEHKDGMLLQMVYAGTTDTKIALQGTILGQGDVRINALEPKKSWWDIMLGLVQVAACVGVLSGGVVSWTHNIKKKQGLRKAGYVGYGIVLLLFIAMVVFTAYHIVSSQFNATPFGF